MSYYSITQMKRWRLDKVKLFYLGHWATISTLFYWVLFFCRYCIFFFSQIKGPWQSCIKDIHQYHFSSNICPLLDFVSILVIFAIFQTVSLLSYMLQWSVISDFGVIIIIVLAFLSNNILWIFCFVLFLFRAAPVAYGDSQARGWIRASSLCHSHSIVTSEPHLQPIPQLTAMLDP